MEKKEPEPESSPTSFSNHGPSSAQMNKMASSSHDANDAKFLEYSLGQAAQNDGFSAPRLPFAPLLSRRSPNKRGRPHFYGVSKGHQVGVFYTWADCHNAVVGFKGACYQGFETEKAAVDFVNAGSHRVNTADMPAEWNRFLAPSPYQTPFSHQTPRGKLMVPAALLGPGSMAPVPGTHASLPDLILDRSQAPVSTQKSSVSPVKVPEVKVPPPEQMNVSGAPAANLMAVSPGPRLNIEIRLSSDSTAESVLVWQQNGFSKFSKPDFQ